MNVVTGIGWITETEYGCVRQRWRRFYSDMKSLRTDLQGDSVFSYPVKGFGRYDRVSQMTCCVTALAFHDAGMSYAEDEKQDIGILGTNSDGCLQSNLDYFTDFVANGRTLGRANYFVYTLPSTPMAEAAIHFKCQGPAPLHDVSQETRRVIAEASRQDDATRRVDGDAGRQIW